MWLLVFLLVILIAYLVLLKNYGHWRKNGVPNPPVSLLFGSLGGIFRKSLGEIYADIYRAYPNLLYVGFYKILKPGIVIRDPKLIREVLVDEANSFFDNDFEVDPEIDPICGRNPYTAKGNVWRTSKYQLAPCFTTIKIKSMYPYIEDSITKMIDFIKNKPESSGKNGLESKELCVKYATEVAADCVFGLEGKLFVEDDPELRRISREIFNTSTYTSTKILIMALYPSLARFLRLKFVTDNVTDYFKNLIKKCMKYRKENNVIRNDFLNSLIELQNKPEYKISEDDILCHTVGIFADGFYVCSGVMVHVLFELAANVHVQDRLLNEIKETLLKRDGKMDYHSLHSMPYLDAVINETLRKHPAELAILRKCTKPFLLPPPRGTGTGPEVHLQVGMPVSIPVLALNMDSKYFPNPKAFNPDRFFETQKEKVPYDVYIPFGEGLRKCYVKEFGLMVVKAAVANLVFNFNIKINTKTETPLKIDRTQMINLPKGEVWLNYYRRTD